MSTELVPIEPPAPQIPAAVQADLLTAFLASLKPKTQEAYAGDLRDFARYLGLRSAAAAVDRLLSLNAGSANGLVLNYRSEMNNRGLSTATIGRRLAALKSMTRMARMLGRIAWCIEIRAPKTEPRRDTCGPDLPAWKKLWRAALVVGNGRRGRRDRALISLLYDLALRRGEVVGLDLADVDLEDGWVAVVGKGKVEHQRLTLPNITRRALAQWIEVRGDWAGPLFTRADRAGWRNRLTGEAVRRIVGELGRKADIKRPMRPHGLRHSAVTQAFRLGWPVQQVQKFTRHKKIETVILYNDEIEDVAGDIAAAVAGQRKLPTTSDKPRVSPPCQFGPETIPPKPVAGEV